MTDLQEQIINEAGNRMAQEIDFQILAGMLCEIGWSKVILKPMTWEQGAEVDLWVEQNVKGNFETMGLVWVFENPAEANWFALRWL